jgi:opacity protein-like surface antigen
LGLGLTYDLSDATLYKGTAGDNIIGDTTWKLKSHYSINLEPGYVFNNNVLAYAKVAYHSGKSNISATGLSLNQSVSGWGYGFGAKFQLDNNLYMKIEAQQINYSTFTFNTTTVEHKSTIGTIGLGYQF